MHNLPKSPQMAGGKRRPLQGPSHRRRPPGRRRAENLAGTKRQTAEKFFNTSGLKYKALGLKDKLPRLGEDEQIALLASDGMLVKRPLVVGKDFVLAGFREKEWQEKLI